MVAQWLCVHASSWRELLHLDDHPIECGKVPAKHGQSASSDSVASRASSVGTAAWNPLASHAARPALEAQRLPTHAALAKQLPVATHRVTMVLSRRAPEWQAIISASLHVHDGMAMLSKVLSSAKNLRKGKPAAPCQGRGP